MSSADERSPEQSRAESRRSRDLSDLRDRSVIAANFARVIGILISLILLIGTFAVGRATSPEPPGNVDPTDTAAPHGGTVNNITNVVNNYDSPTPERTFDEPSERSAEFDPAESKPAQEAAERDHSAESSQIESVSPPTTVATPREARVILNDDPFLTDLDADSGGKYSWFKPPAAVNSYGFGDDGFRFTIAIGESGDEDLDNFARWEFDEVNGEYKVEAWIPAAWATATIDYLIWVDENNDGHFSREENLPDWKLDQSEASGWRSLGVYDFDGRVRIEVRDTRSEDDWRTNSGDEIARIESSRIAVDAIRLVEQLDR